jgi:hypothetical protein
LQIFDWRLRLCWQSLGTPVLAAFLRPEHFRLWFNNGFSLIPPNRRRIDGFCRITLTPVRCRLRWSWLPPLALIAWIAFAIALYTPPRPNSSRHSGYRRHALHAIIAAASRDRCHFSRVV